MDSPPALFDADSELGQSYFAAMKLAGEYAYAGRDIVVPKVLEILGADAVHEVHNHHNFAWREEHNGRITGCPQGLHAGAAGPGGIRRRLDGGQLGDPRGRREPGRDRLAVLDRARRRPRHEPDAGGGSRAAPQALDVHRCDCGRVFDIDGISSAAGVPKRASAPTIPRPG